MTALKFTEPEPEPEPNQVENLRFIGMNQHFLRWLQVEMESTLMLMGVLMDDEELIEMVVLF